MDNAHARILVVDDNHANRYAVARTLRSEGFEVVEADTGLKGLAAARSDKPDLLVLDVNLPDIPGFEITQKLRADPETSPVSIMHLSATYTEPPWQALGLGLGADAYLTHPFDPRVLVATVRALLRLRNAERRLADLLEGERAARKDAERAREAAEQAERAQRSAEAHRIRLLGELEAALRARDELLATATHDLRTPLHVLQLGIDSLVHSVTQNGEDLPLPRLLARLDLVRNQAKRLSQMFESLLDISRFDSGRMPVELETVDLSALAREVAGRMQAQCAASGSELRFAGELDVVGCWDRIRLEQIMTNLFSNAFKYGAGKPIEIAVRRSAASAQLVVRDHGIGIAPADQERIFGRFERARTDHDQKSFGLGLWIVRRILDALGGRIDVDSEPGVGSVFTVELPLAEGALPQ